MKDIHELVFDGLRMIRHNQGTDALGGLILICAYGHATGDTPRRVTNDKIRRYAHMRGFELTHYAEMRAQRIAARKMRG